MRSRPSTPDARLRTETGRPEAHASGLFLALSGAPSGDPRERMSTQIQLCMLWLGRLRLRISVA